jgi:hypothetical protein
MPRNIFLHSGNSFAALDSFRWSDYFRRFFLPHKILLLPRKIYFLHALYGLPLNSISVRLFCIAEEFSPFFYCRVILRDLFVLPRSFFAA